MRNTNFSSLVHRAQAHRERIIYARSSNIWLREQFARNFHMGGTWLFGFTIITFYFETTLYFSWCCLLTISFIYICVIAKFTCEQYMKKQRACGCLTRYHSAIWKYGAEVIRRETKNTNDPPKIYCIYSWFFYIFLYIYIYILSFLHNCERNILGVYIDISMCQGVGIAEENVHTPSG